MEDREVKRHAKQMQKIFDAASLPTGALAAEIVREWSTDQIVTLVSTVWTMMVIKYDFPSQSWEDNKIDENLREMTKEVMKFTTLGADLAKWFNVDPWK